MNISGTRVRAILIKELRDLRRNRSVLVGMLIFPLIFSIAPLVNIFELSSASAGGVARYNVLLYMLGIPAIVPAVVAAYAVAGERQQGTLEPVLITPIRREEFLLAKALAALLPSVVVAYAAYAIVLALIQVFAQPGVAGAVLHPSEMLVQVLFTPLIAGWSIWLGIAVSTRASDTRVAQQLGVLACVPTALIAALFAYAVIPATFGIGVACVVLLVFLNVTGWRVTSRLFDRERLITGTK
jgi:ABC-type transport system involved in multi-copper enzyme maturation permease subunit